MEKTSETRLVRTNMYEMQKRFGLDRRYPPNGVPETSGEITYTEEEEALLSKPLIFHARLASK